MVDDLSSTNGTQVNGQRVTAATALVPGDRVQMGHVVIEATR
jgi:pSer/pThr/pTyr-binding forkhead associated (FHA) protein